jgi:glycosyltransferase involved in cell wall biosynthesis
MGTISLCICTMNRPDELRTALESIFAGSRVPHEVIVGDDGDGSARSVAEAFPGVIYVEGPRRGLGANRNCCIEAATGSAIAFIDDDVTVHSTFIERAEQVVQPGTIVTGWELNYSFSPPRKVSAHNASFLGFQSRDPGQTLNAICINATVFPTSLFDSALFDEQIRYGYEEIDIARHATSLGWRIKYDDELSVSHFPSQTNRDSYAAALNVSRLYITHKAYARYERRPLKAAAFNVVAGIHHVLYSVKGRHGVGRALRTIRDARAKQKAGRLVGVSK